MFEHFHHDARAAVEHAGAEAARSGGQEIGTGHLLLGLLERPGHAADALAASGADAADLRAHISPGEAPRPEPRPEPPAGGGTAPGSGQPAPDAAVGAVAAGQVRIPRQRGRDRTGEPPLTRDARRALELAQRAAKQLMHQHVTSGHLLLGVIDQPGSPAVQALTVAGIHVGMLRADVLQRMMDDPSLAPP